MKRFLIIIAVAAAAAFFVPSASAGGAKPYLTITPTSPRAPGSFTVSGCNYKAEDVYVTVWHNPVTGGVSGPGTVGFTQEAIAVGGCFSFTFSTTQWGSSLAEQQGQYQAHASQDHGPAGVNYIIADFTVQ